MSLEENFERERAELVAAGSQPTRYAALVRLIRRFVWPFIRPFTFYLLRKISRTEHEMEGLKRHIEGFARKEEELARLVVEQIMLRSEVAALRNRYALVDHLADQIVALDKKIDAGPTREQQAMLCSDLDVLKNRLGALGSPEDLANLLNSSRRAAAREIRVTNTPNGIFVGKPGELISDFIFNGGIWDEHIIALARGVAKARRGKAVDVGAHFGSMTIAFAGLFDEVYSFEPNDFNFRMLRSNVSINLAGNVRLHNCGLYSHETVLSMAKQSKQEIALPLNASGEFDGNLGSNLGAYLFDEGGSQLFRHVAKTLDSYALNDVALIKIDVQGADGEVLMGCTETIKRCNPVIVFEWEERLSRNFNVSLDHVRLTLDRLNYEVTPLKIHNDKQVDYVARRKLM